jgi:8-oxo-dGTP pyrophosphatase MutT (NUDIX family)
MSSARGGSPAAIRDAATVVLLRDHAEGLQAWLLTRVTQMVFAGGMSVFPGGRVDDGDTELPFAPDAGIAVAERFGCDTALARRLLGAAVRETFEETGVLLCTPAADLSGARTDVEAGRVRFGDLLRDHGLTVDSAALLPWARWITPPGEVRRYDTRFFVATLPDGADAADLTTESSAADWVRPGDALEQAQRGERRLLPPTLVTLASLQPFGTAAEVLAAAGSRSLDAISPDIHVEGERIIAELPGGETFELPRSLFHPAKPRRAERSAPPRGPRGS